MGKLELLLKRLSVVSIVFIMDIGVTGCLDKNLNDVYKGEKEETPNDFGFLTSNEVTIDLQYAKALKGAVKVELYTENPLAVDEAKSYVKVTNQAPFLEGNTDADGKLNFKVTLPSSVTKVYAYSTSIGVPALLSANISGNIATGFVETEIPLLSNIDGRSIGSRDGTGYVAGATEVKGRYDSWVKLKYTLSGNTPEKVETTSIKEEWLAAIERTLYATITSVDRYTRESIKIEEDADVTIYYVGHGQNDRVNALAYYTYGADGTDRPEASRYTKQNPPYLTIGSDENKHPLTLAMTELSRNAPAAGTGYKMQYFNGTSFQDKFPAGSYIDFALLVDAYQGNTLKADVNAVFSEMHTPYAYNKYRAMKVVGGELQSTVIGEVPHMAAFKLNDTHMVIAFEDQPYNGGSDEYGGDFRDDVFILEIDPKIPSDLPEAVEPDKPAYSIVVREGAILGFEDNWPKAGDYDMNDVMLSYVRSCYYDGDWSLVMMDDDFVFLNNGATYQNAFGYELGYNGETSNVDVKLSSSYQCTGQGLDEDINNGKKPVVMLFDNGKAVSVGTRFNVNTIFKNPVTSYDKYYGAWGGINPFIVVNGFLDNPRREVHLVNKVPTSKVDTSVDFGTEFDCSDPSKGIWYVLNTSSVHPFAISIAGDIEIISSTEGYVTFPEFKIPLENHPIEESYPQFKTWYESGGKNATDWYKSPSF